VIAAIVAIVDNFHRVRAAADRAIVRNLKRVSFLLFTAERESIKEAPGPSTPGTPPHTHTGGVRKRGKRAGQRKLGFLPRSFAYFVDKTKQESLTGPRHSVIGEAAAAHELGLEFRGDDYPERSFAQPALKAVAPVYGDSFANSIGA
jgi:hypothetical protein